MTKLALITGDNPIGGTFGTNQIICSEDFDRNQFLQISPITQTLDIRNNKFRSTKLTCSFTKNAYLIPNPYWAVSLIDYHYADPPNGFGTIDNVHYIGYTDSVKEDEDRFTLTAFDSFYNLFEQEILPRYAYVGTVQNDWVTRQYYLDRLENAKTRIRRTYVEEERSAWIQHLFDEPKLLAVGNGFELDNKLITLTETSFSGKTCYFQYLTSELSGTFITDMFNYPQDITYNEVGISGTSLGTNYNIFEFEFDRDIWEELSNQEDFPDGYLYFHTKIDKLPIYNDPYNAIRNIISNQDGSFTYHKSNILNFGTNTFAEQYSKMILLDGNLETNSLSSELSDILISSGLYLILNNENKFEVKTFNPHTEARDISDYVINKQITENIFDLGVGFDSLQMTYGKDKEKTHFKAVTGSFNTRTIPNKYLTNLTSVMAVFGRLQRLVNLGQEIQFELSKQFGTLNLLDVISCGSYSANNFYALTEIQNDIYKNSYSCKAIQFAKNKYPVFGSVSETDISDGAYPAYQSTTYEAGTFCDFPKIPPFSVWTDESAGIPRIVEDGGHAGTFIGGTLGTIYYDGLSGTALQPYQALTSGNGWHILSRSSQGQSFESNIEINYLGRLELHYPTSGVPVDGIGTLILQRYSNQSFGSNFGDNQYLVIAGSTTIAEYLNIYGTVYNLPTDYKNELNFMMWY